MRDSVVVVEADGVAVFVCDFAYLVAFVIGELSFAAIRMGDDCQVATVVVLEFCGVAQCITLV